MITGAGVVASALLYLASVHVATGVAATPSPPFAQCPAIGADTGCGLLIDVTNAGTSVLTDPGLGPYDGEDDTLVGVLNQSSGPLAELPLTSTADIFGFDGDGICASPFNVFNASCPFGPTGYEGPGTSFVASSPTSGHVSFNPAIPPGGSAYFALEEAIDAAQLTAGPPTVQITSGPPAETTSQSATFAFTGVSGGTYECKIDNGPWTPCSSGQAFTPILPGDHLFQVRETLGGLVGPAATYQWTVALPKACVLRVARARVFVFTHHHKIRLVIHYTSYQPAEVDVSYRLGGPAGGLSLGSATGHFHLAGVFRLPEALRPAENRKVAGAKSMKVTFRIKGTPGFCGRYYTKRLTIPKKIFGQTVWFQSDSRFGPASK
ncbi:MAG: hypothetical protein JST59_09440 [Actinobacteria bacterium]|nr:hypothetical protein [Actinomycetota bacterium]